MYQNYKIKNFLDLSLEEHKTILNWRNNKSISKWMIKKQISLKEHLSFIENLKNSNKRYFLLEDIGVVYFTIYKDFIEIGLYKNPNKQKVGKKLLEFAINYAFNELKAKKIILYVFEDNVKAINLYKKFGFIQTDKKDDLIKMELENENRKP